MKIAIKARMQDGTPGIVFLEATATWIPMNVGDQIAPDDLPLQFLGIEMKTDKGIATGVALIPTVLHLWD